VGGDGVVVQGVRQINGEFAFVALRAQAEIDAEDRAFRRGAGEDVGDLLGQANEVFAVGDGCGGRLFPVAIDEQQVDV
jgi:hypothetical protein